MSKVCLKCKEEKSLSEFHIRTIATAKGDKTYVNGVCNRCKYETVKAWRKVNREKCRQQNREYYARKKAGIKRKSRQTHEEIQANGTAYKNKRRKKDPNFKLRENLRSRVYHALYGNLKSARTLELLSTSVEHLRQHLEVQFLPGMNWGNHGKGEGTWQIDHIMPCASFDFTDADQQKRCFHWTNLQPLWEKDNNAKSDKVPENRLWVDSATGWVNK